jgi:hypothetical protein
VSTTRERSIRQKQYLAIAAVLLTISLGTVFLTKNAEDKRTESTGPAPAQTKDISLGLTESAKVAERTADAIQRQEMLQRIKQLEEANRSLVASQRDFNEAVRRGGAVAPPGLGAPEDDECRWSLLLRLHRRP